jgi:hypothetical protein
MFPHESPNVNLPKRFVIARHEAISINNSDAFNLREENIKALATLESNL